MQAGEYEGLAVLSSDFVDQPVVHLSFREILGTEQFIGDQQGLDSVGFVGDEYVFLAVGDSLEVALNHCLELLQGFHLFYCFAVLQIVGHLRVGQCFVQAADEPRGSFDEDELVQLLSEVLVGLVAAGLFHILQELLVHETRASHHHALYVFVVDCLEASVALLEESRQRLVVNLLATALLGYVLLYLQLA